MSQNLISAKDIPRTEFEALCEQAELFRRTTNQTVQVDASRQGALLFFEPSTRTRTGFEAAAWKLGIRTIPIYETKYANTMGAAESVADTIRTLNPYTNFFCVRHSDKNIFDQILPYTSRPVINCGNGDQEHPTQALIDLYTMLRRFSVIDGLNIVMTGALCHSRAARSLLTILASFKNVTVAVHTVPDLNFSEEEIRYFTKNGNEYQFLTSPNWNKYQVVYSAGFPLKTPSGSYSQAVRDKYKITPRIANELGKGIIMNPLPRIDEIDFEVDDTPQAHYFQQNENGLYMRMAIINHYCLES